jgi:hypothetical protein
MAVGAAAPVLAALAALVALEAAAPAALLAEASMTDLWEATEAEALGLAARTELKLASSCEAWLLMEERAALAELWADAMRLEAPDAREETAPEAELAAEPAAEVAELPAEPAAEVAEPMADPAADVREAMTEPGAPTTDESCPAMSLITPPWAATPAARRVVAAMEKRMLSELGWLVVGCWRIGCVLVDEERVDDVEEERQGGRMYL